MTPNLGARLGRGFGGLHSVEILLWFEHQMVGNGKGVIMKCTKCGNDSPKDGNCLECGAHVFYTSWELVLVALILLLISLVLRFD